MDEEFRGVLADVVDGRAWAGSAGPGAAVRRRGERRRLRAAVGASVAGVAAVAAVAMAAGVTMAGGTGKPVSSGASGGGSTPTPAVPAAHGRYVSLSSALLHPEDVGQGFVADPSIGLPPSFATGMCVQDKPRVTAGSPVDVEFSGIDTNGDRVTAIEDLYQFQDSTSARSAFEAAHTAFQAGCGKTAPSYQAQDVGGVGDGMFVVHFPLPVNSNAWTAYVLTGGVVIEYTIRDGSDKGLKTIPDGWLTAGAQKAAARVRSAPLTDKAPVIDNNSQFGGPHSSAPRVTTSQPLPVSQPVDGVLFAPADLGSSFGADQNDKWQTKPIPTAISGIGMIFRGTMTGGDGELLVNEGVSRFTDAAAAHGGLVSYAQSSAQTHAPAVALPGFGDEAWIKHWDQKGGLTVAIRSGANVITFDVLAGGASADQPIPGGDGWVRQIAHTALQRLAAAK